MLKAQTICSSLLLVVFSSIAAAQSETAKIDKIAETTTKAKLMIGGLGAFQPSNASRSNDPTREPS